MTTIGHVIDAILDEIPGGKLANTVDTVKCGDPAQEVTGIVTTFLASYAVIQQAVRLGANFIITHEPTFYNHLDRTDWLADNPVYTAKRRLLDEHHIVVWCFHDHWHRYEPDGITTGVIKTLGWEAYPLQDSYIVTIPATTVGALVAELKARLGIDTVSVVGRLSMPCRHVAMMVGAPPAEWQMAALAHTDVDVVVTGEVREWETSEAARDAVAQGLDKALIVLGHAKSEEPGMAYLVEWLKQRFPDLPIAHVPVGDAFIYP
jgi:putative NIF3 family GTP cyclohydrolase 1 type 2